jgi:hypothetical protein
MIEHLHGVDDVRDEIRVKRATGEPRTEPKNNGEQSDKRTRHA